MDHLTPEKRSWNMSRIRGQDTGPEKAVRSLLHRLGFRFRLHRRDLPGHPDVVLPKYRTALFVHGCFWHRHAGCRNATVPGTRTAWWQAKFDANVRRDAAVRDALAAAGWRVLVVWECELSDADALAARLHAGLQAAPAPYPAEAPPLLEAAEELSDYAPLPRP